jgi:ribosome maturation factor RimP
VSVDRIRDRLTEVLTAPVAHVGLDVEAIEVSQAGKRRVLRVAVDRDGGVTMDDIADATREVSRVLDGSDVMGSQPYTLEVSSPGTDRPLVLPRHWRRNRGRLVKASLQDGTTLTGRVADSDDTGAVLDVDGARHEVRFDSVTRAKVQIEFNRRPDQPGVQPDEHGDDRLEG